MDQLAVGMHKQPWLLGDQADLPYRSPAVNNRYSPEGRLQPVSPSILEGCPEPASRSLTRLAHDQDR